MKLYTKTGDDGSTGLHGAGRVSKCDLRVAAYGDSDELNSVIGWVRCGCGNDNTNVNNSQVTFIDECLNSVQKIIFEIGADLCTPAGSASASASKKISPITQSDINLIESWIDKATAEVPVQKSFILPTGCELAARLHVARTVARRFERSIVQLIERDSKQVNGAGVAGKVVIYVNRLSDLLFVLARLANHVAGIDDEPWIPRQGNSAL